MLRYLVVLVFALIVVGAFKTLGVSSGQFRLLRACGFWVGFGYLIARCCYFGVC